MGATPQPEIIEEARRLWTEEGLSPEEIVEALFKAVRDGTLKLKVPGEKARLPNDRSSIYRWANTYHWHPHWRVARKHRLAAIAPGEPFGVSGVRDPVWHLSVVRGRRFAREYTQGEGYNLRDRDCLSHTLLHVIREIEPPAPVLWKLKPILREEIKNVRRAMREAQSKGRVFEGPARSYYDASLIPAEVEEGGRNESR